MPFFRLTARRGVNFWKMPCFSFPMRDRKKRHESKNVALDETYKMRGRFSTPSLFVAEKCHFFDLRLDEESISEKCLVSPFLWEIGEKDTNSKMLPATRPTKWYGGLSFCLFWLLRNCLFCILGPISSKHIFSHCLWEIGKIDTNPKM